MCEECHDEWNKKGETVFVYLHTFYMFTENTSPGP